MHLPLEVTGNNQVKKKHYATVFGANMIAIIKSANRNKILIHRHLGSPKLFSQRDKIEGIGITNTENTINEISSPKALSIFRLKSLKQTRINIIANTKRIQSMILRRINILGPVVDLVF